MLSAMTLGAQGLQIGSRFGTSIESSAHQAFKAEVLKAKDGATQLTPNELTPVRLLKNKFYQDVVRLYQSHPTQEDLKKFLGRARAKKGMFEGDLEEGELEIGQIAGLIDDILPVKEIIEQIITEFNIASKEMSNLKL